MDRRFIHFLLLSFVILIVSQKLNQMFFPPKLLPVAQENAPAAGKNGAAQAQNKQANGAADAAKTDLAKTDTAKADANAKSPDAKEALNGDQQPAVEAESLPQRWYTLGGMNKDDKLLVTLTNQGAAVERVELPEFTYLEDNLDFFEEMEKKRWHRAGYLGQLALTSANPTGALVNVVGIGTPAEQAGLKVGDVILEISGNKTGSQKIESATRFDRRAATPQA